MIEVFLCRFFWIEIFPTLFWGLVVSGTIIGSLCIICPLIKYHINSRTTILDKQHQFEEKMKADAFDREKEWRDLEKSKEEIEKELNKQIKELKEEKDKLETELKVVNNWNELLQNQQKVCIELYNKLSSEIKFNETK